MKKYVTTLFQSTDLKPSGRITISYFSSMTPKRLRSFYVVYVRVGRMVVSSQVSREASVLHTLRVMLTALCLFPDYLRTVPAVRSRVIAGFSLSAFIKVRERKYMRMPLNLLCRNAVQSAAVLSNSVPGGHLRLISSRNVKTSIASLMTSYVTLIQYYDRYSKRSENISR